MSSLARDGYTSPWVEMYPGTRLCTAAVKHGYDSIQLAEEGCAKSQAEIPRRTCYLEVVSCHAGCLALPNKGHYRACVPGVPLRTGWAATAPCVCNDSLLLLNCLAGAGAALPPPTDVLTAPFPEGKRQAAAPLAFRPYSAQVLGACSRSAPKCDGPRPPPGTRKPRNASRFGSR